MCGEGGWGGGVMGNGKMVVVEEGWMGVGGEMVEKRGMVGELM